MSQPPTIVPKRWQETTNRHCLKSQKSTSHLHRVRSLKSRNGGGVTFSAISRVFSLLCWSCTFQIYENYPTTGKGQEEIG